ncbi:2-oxo acid dehydrogenase subunit E2 [Kineococcus aurantiacus]|uniref:Pyruvate/2-oxoglutarate dehydrogenase complex dihydrolipoamide acyltransferase (E2) component n=1 Tax=Kineococcus aurantiacus TaxID=37633 RepID=A0A7Y9J385_9ACTN|nr:2-oxo acid dehydrogenase subunit E2 [Kineococcus aurantiacus]NYD25087.1 pyruvate/2-oxoglutarate dehydrogenase complex dihydrolipoamide acyltransferase (E2) component [Kineococcus aurantiacus]
MSTSATVAGLTGRTEKLSRIRKVIARRMVQSLQTSAQLTTVVEVDLHHVAALREEEKQRFADTNGTKLTFLPFLAKAALEGLSAHPVVNAAVDLDAGEVTYYDSRNLSVAVDTDRGLMVPVIADAGSLDVTGLALAIAEVAERARTGRLGPDDQANGTFTITNTGSRGALFDTPIINQPQVAILGTGTVVDRPVVVAAADGRRNIEIRPVAHLFLSYDHRIVDGADAARYLGTVRTMLQTPQWSRSVLG